MSTSLQGIWSIGANAGLLFASQSIASAARVVYAIVIARMLGPEHYGLFNFGLGWYATFLAVANLYLEGYISRAIALDPSARPVLLSRALTLRIFSTLLVLIVAAAFAMSSEGEARNVLVILLLALVGRSIAMWCTSAFVSSELMRHLFRAEVAFRLLEVVIGMCLLLAGFGLYAIVALHAVSWCVQALFGYLLVRRHLSDVRLRPVFAEQIALFRAVLPVALSSIGATWLIQGPFVLSRSYATDAGEVGQIALAVQIFAIVGGIPLAIGRAALPALSRSVERSNKRDADFLIVVLRAAFIGATAMTIAAAALGEWVVPAVFGEPYRAAGSNLAYAVALILPFGLGTTVNQLLLAHDRRWAAMTAAAAAAVSMTLLIVAAGPGQEISEYLVRVFAGQAVWAAVALLFVSKDVKVNIGVQVAKLAVVSLLSGAIFFVTSSYLAGSVTALAASLLVMTLLYWATGAIRLDGLKAFARMTAPWTKNGS